VAPARGWLEADLGEFRHKREMRYLLAVIDVGTKRLYGVSLRTKDAAKVSEAIDAVLREAKPVVFRSDIGSEFVNSTVARLLRRFGVRQAATRGTCHFVERVLGTSVATFLSDLRSTRHSHSTTLWTRL
jgi:transposase InsO family protein